MVIFIAGMEDILRGRYSLYIKLKSIMALLKRSYVFSLRFLEIYSECSCIVWINVWAFDVLCLSKLVFKNHLHSQFSHVNKQFWSQKGSLGKKEMIVVYLYRCIPSQFPLLFFSSYRHSLSTLSPFLSASQNLMIYQIKYQFLYSSHSDHSFCQFERVQTKVNLCFLKCYKYLFEWN